MMSYRSIGLFVLTLLTVCPSAASAHPHILATVRLDVGFDGHSSPQILKSAWTYDAFYAALAKRQIDTDHDGVYSDEELQRFADGQLKALRDFGYFTSMSVDGRKVRLGEAAGGRIQTNSDGALTLSFAQTLLSPQPGHMVEIEIFDPHFFAYFTVPQDGSAVRLSNAPAACKTAASGPSPIDLKRPASVPQLFWAALDGASDASKTFANKVSVSCP